MSILSFLTGNAKSVEKVIDAGISGLDKLVFTDEEKADYNNKLQLMHLEFVKIAASESTAQSISRRMICLPVVYLYLVLIAGSVIAELMGTEVSAFNVAIDALTMPALAAIGFYVGRHMLANK